jgi:hypothetical protein
MCSHICIMYTSIQVIMDMRLHVYKYGMYRWLFSLLQHHSYLLLLFTIYYLLLQIQGTYRGLGVYVLTSLCDHPCYGHVHYDERTWPLLNSIFFSFLEVHLQAMVLYCDLSTINQAYHVPWHNSTGGISDSKLGLKYRSLLRLNLNHRILIWKPPHLAKH